MTIRYQKTWSQKPVPHREIAQVNWSRTEEYIGSLADASPWLENSVQWGREWGERNKSGQGPGWTAPAPQSRRQGCVCCWEYGRRTRNTFLDRTPVPPHLPSTFAGRLSPTALLLLLGHFLSLSGSDQQKAIPTEPSWVPWPLFCVLSRLAAW